MNPNDLSILVRKVEELRALMVFTQRTLPFLDDVFAFVMDIVPLLDVLRSSVESTSEKLPKASRQLHSVTTATEVASTEILNIVESITAKVARLRDDVEARRTGVATARAHAERVRALAARAHAAHTDGGGELVASAEAAVAAIASLEPDATLSGELESIQHDCTNIMIALQVQDITAQQIAAVNALMQSVDEGLSRLLKHFSASAADHDAMRYRHSRLDIVFDVSAAYDTTGGRQKAADEVIAQTRRQGKATRPPVRTKKNR